MEMLIHTIATDSNRTVVDNGMPEEVGSLAPIVVLLDVGNALESDDFRYLCIGMNTSQFVFLLKQRIEYDVMTEAMCKCEIALVACDGCHIGKCLVETSMFTS